MKPTPGCGPVPTGTASVETPSTAALARCTAGLGFDGDAAVEAATSCVLAARTQPRTGDRPAAPVVWRDQLGHGGLRHTETGAGHRGQPRDRQGHRLRPGRSGWDVAVTGRTCGRARDATTPTPAGAGPCPAAWSRPPPWCGRRAAGPFLWWPTSTTRPRCAVRWTGWSPSGVGVDLLVNNAVDTGPGSMVPVVELTVAQMEAKLAANVVANLVLVQAVLPGMLERGRGTIVDVTSHTATADPPGPVGRGRLGPGLRRLQGRLPPVRPPAGRRAGRPGDQRLQHRPGLCRDRAPAGQRLRPRPGGPLLGCATVGARRRHRLAGRPPRGRGQRSDGQGPQDGTDPRPPSRLAHPAGRDDGGARPLRPVAARWTSWPGHGPGLRSDVRHRSGHRGQAAGPGQPGAGADHMAVLDERLAVGLAQRGRASPPSASPSPGRGRHEHTVKATRTTRTPPSTEGRSIRRPRPSPTSMGWGPISPAPPGSGRRPGPACRRPRRPPPPGPGSGGGPDGGG